MPRYRNHSSDRVQLIYADKEGNSQLPPISHWLLSTLLPEEEIVNFGMNGIEFTAPLIMKAGISTTLINQTKGDIANGKIGNFFKPYKLLGLDNPISGVYPQAFNERFGTDDNAFYLCKPKHYDSDKTYPLVVFCHGYLGNWQLFQGIWKELDGAIVATIGTRDLSGFYVQQDINSIFDFYIPMLERMGYKIDHSRIHLIGLSNGGSAIVADTHSSHAKDFESITAISCNLRGMRRVPCRVNLIGGGQDKFSKLMPSRYEELNHMGVNVALYFEEDENHYILVNQREEILEFLKERMMFQTVGQ